MTCNNQSNCSFIQMIMIGLLIQGAIDHVIFYPNDFFYITIQCVTYPVTRAATIILLLSFSLLDTLLILFLSNNLFSISSIRANFNYAQLMCPTFYPLQIILNKEIIGHGTRRSDLYYMIILVLTKQIRCKTLNIRNERSGYGIDVWSIFNYIRHLFHYFFPPYLLLI